jgi:YidC/Oxa1 family membrane protein insertase
MQIIGDLFNLILLQPTINLIALILMGLESLRLPGALGFSIIILTIIVRAVSWPFTAQQMRSMKKTMDLKPKLDELKNKHKDDKQALAQATMALYKEHGVNPAGGCLPAIIQIALIFPLYQVVEAFLNPQAGLERINYFLYSASWHLDALPDPTFLGFNLAHKPIDFYKGEYLMLLVPLISVVSQFILSKMMYPPTVKPYPSDSPKEKKEKVKSEDMAEAMQSQMMFVMPLMVGYFAFTFPLGLSLYWITLNIMSIWQQYLITGLGGLKPWIDRIKSYKS